MMDTQSCAASAELDAIGARAIPEFEGVHDVWPRGRRLEAVREAAAAYKPRFKAQGQVTAVSPWTSRRRRTRSRSPSTAPSAPRTCP